MRQNIVLGHFGRCIVLVLLFFVVTTSLISCGSTRPTKRSPSGRKYRPLKCPCDRRSSESEGEWRIVELETEG
ncbi:MAG: hypothetical protein ACTTKZ_03830 [Bacteroides sp.]